MTMVGTVLGPYELIAPLGAGGMGEVYRARDRRLGREVAVKILPPHLACNAEMIDRFEREARAVAAVSHPNIVALHDVGRQDDHSYVVMELVQGQTLYSLLQKGRLPVKRAVAFATQCARALAAAHQRGIIHRDLKPSNVVITEDDTVKILDFGLAKVADSSAPGSDETVALTQPGVLMGTMGYAPPEQLRGTTVDHRADIFSIGVMLHEMLAGGRPFQGRSKADIIAAVLGDRRATLAEPGLPPTLIAIVERCLAPEVEQRFASARELAGALEAVNLEISSVPGVPKLPARPRTSVCVLPFYDLSPGRDHEYFCDGMAEEIASALARVPRFDVVPRSTTLQFKGRTADPREIGRTLSISTIIEGSVRAIGDRLRVTVTMTDAAAGFQIWSDRYDRTLADVFAVQDEIATEVVGALHRTARLEALDTSAETVLTGTSLDDWSSRLGSRLSRDSQRGTRRGTEDVEAYTAYLKGRHYWNQRTETDLAESLTFFNRAVERDPGYADAWAGQADALVTLGMWGSRPASEVMEPARHAAELAVSLNPTLAEPHAALAIVKGMYDWSWAQAEREFEAALTLDPTAARVHQWYAMHLLVLGRFAEAERELQAAVAIEPLSPVVSLSVGLVPLYQRQYRRAVEAFDRTIAMAPGFPQAHYFLGQALSEMGEHAQALPALEIARAVASPEIEAAVACALARSGDASLARTRLQAVTELSTKRYVSPCVIARVHGCLGEPAEALRHLERAAAERAADLAWLGLRPEFSTLKGDPAFRNLIERVGVTG